MARPELLERRPQWPVTLRLEPLHPDEVEELMPPQIGSSLRSRIARAAGGNPLFITEMLAMTGDAQTDVVVPPTLHALLTALIELDGIVGYHVEQAWRYQKELGLSGGEPLAHRARSRLVTAGRRALMRQDYAAAVNLLERAMALSSLDEIDIALVVDLAEALF